MSTTSPRLGFDSATAIGLLRFRLLGAARRRLLPSPDARHRCLRRLRLARRFLTQAAFLRRARLAGVSASRRQHPCAGAAGFAAAAPPRVVDGQHDLTDLDPLPLLDADVLDGSGNARRDLDGRLVGFELEDRLILGDRVPRRDEHADNIAGGDVFAELGESEVCGHSVRCLEGTKETPYPFGTSVSSWPGSASPD